ncbi:MAG TPA: ABC transporter permease [Conexibacter sp.]|nr:ABC transporter permease [Conexibacter sp.]
MNLGRFVRQRLAYFAIGLVFVVTITFLITRVLPGDPTYFLLSTSATKERVEQTRDALGLNDSIPTQYVTYLKQLAHGDLGDSIRTNESVLSDIGARWPATLELGLAAGFLAMAWAIPLGTLAALRKGSRVDGGARLLTGVGISTPEFWLGMILILVFFSLLGVAPPPIGRTAGSAPEHVTGFYLLDSVLTGNSAAFWAALKQLILPAVTLAVVAGAPIFRVTRALMIDALESDYVRSARALGVPQSRILVRHAFPNVLVPLSAMLVLIFGWVLGGTVLVEYVFAWPGMGKYAVDSIAAADYAPVMGVLLVSAITYLFLYLVTDFMHLVLDPRTRT